MDQSINASIHIDHSVASYYILHYTYILVILYFLLRHSVYFLLGNDGMESAILLQGHALKKWPSTFTICYCCYMLTHSLENQHVVCVLYCDEIFNCLFILLISSLFYSLYANINFSLLDSAEWCIIRYKNWCCLVL